MALPILIQNPLSSGKLLTSGLKGKSLARAYRKKDCRKDNQNHTEGISCMPKYPR